MSTSSCDQMDFCGNGTSEPTNWRKGDVIGRGAYGTVHRATIDTGNGQLELAVKEVGVGSARVKSKYEEPVKKETEALRKLSHERIIKYYGFCSTKQMFYIFMEYMEYGSLDDYIETKTDNHEKIDEVYAGQIAKQIIEGVVYLHNNNYFHRDIKSANILMSDEHNVKLADFGLIKQFTEITKTYTKGVGTYRFMAPEMIDPDIKYNKSVDIWAVGCIVLHMLSGKQPFPDLEEQHISKKLDKDPTPAKDISTKVSESCRRFFKKSLAINPSARATAESLLTDNFVTGTELPDLEVDAEIEVTGASATKSDVAKSKQQPGVTHLH